MDKQIVLAKITAIFVLFEEYKMTEKGFIVVEINKC